MSFQSAYTTNEQVARLHFRKSDSLASLKHLKEEIKELEDELNVSVDRRDRYNIQQELADCFLCLMSVGAKLGFSAEMIEAEIQNKATINLNRKWKYNGDGTYSHIKETDTNG